MFLILDGVARPVVLGDHKILEYKPLKTFFLEEVVVHSTMARRNRPKEAFWEHRNKFNFVGQRGHFADPCV